MRIEPSGPWAETTGSAPETLVDLLRLRATTQADQRAYTFLLDGEDDAETATYAALDRRARAIGARLQQLGVAGERALLLYQPGLEYIAAFFGCLYAGVTAVPAYPPNPAKVQRTLPRLQTIVHDARPAVALTSADIVSVADAIAAVAPDFGDMHWLATDTLSDDLADAWQAPAITGDALAMLQYTSGSTSAPKGVMLSHANLLHNLSLIYECFGHSPASSGVIWLPPYHDMGLIGGILQPLYGGFPVALMAPVAFLQRPIRWLQAITTYAATTSGGPNFAYDLCLRKITPEQRATLDLSSWTVAFNGAEPLRSETMDRFAETFAACGFRRDAFLPCYGLAEATLIVSGKPHDAHPVTRAFGGTAIEQHRALPVRPDDPAARVLVGCGPALGGQQVAIVRPETGVTCAPDEIGEIWVSGPSVASGYWNRHDETRQTFGARLAGDDGPFLRTGDLGFMSDGELYITGRLKDLLIIRGRNHYPQDIELTVEQSHPALRSGGGAAFTVEIDGDEQLVIAQEVERQHRSTHVDELAAAIRQAVAQYHDLHVHAVMLLKPGGLAKTSSGKVRRRSTRADYLAGTLPLIGSSTLDEAAADSEADQLQPSREQMFQAAPAERRSLLEAYLRAEIARGLKISPRSVEPQQPLSTLGIDSLMAVELQHRLESELGITVSMTSFLEGASIAQIAADTHGQIAPSANAAHVEPIAAHGGQEHPLSYGQRAMWFLNQLAPDSAAYNIAGAVRIRSALDSAAVQRAFTQLSQRHAALRTTFALRDGEPVQIVHDQPALVWSAEQIPGWSDATLNDRLTEAVHRPFDLATGPLLRVHLFSRAADEHVLLVVVHHIVADLWSLAILVQEFGQLYAAETTGAPVTLDPLPIRYADWARWQNDRLTGERAERDWQFWQQALRLDGARDLPVLQLPTDRPRPAVQSYRGASHGFRIDSTLAQALKARGQERHATLYTVLLTAFHTLLHRYTGQREIIVGSPTAGRQHAGIAGLVGYFVNPIPVRATIDPDRSFAALLDQVRATVLAAFEHGEYPLPLLIERLNLGRDLSHSPLFQTMFILQKAPALGDLPVETLALGAQHARVELGGLELESLSLDQHISQFDLTLTIGEVDGGLAGTWEYNTDLFDAATIERLATHFEQLLAGIAADPERPVAALPLLTDADRRQLDAWNATATDDVQPASLVELFERQAALTRESIAVLLPETGETLDLLDQYASEQRSLSYAELNARANQLARYLRGIGVGPEVCVGLCLERSVDLIVAILGVLKAGGAYVPLDPDYPAERLQFILRETRARALLTHERLLAAPGGETAICLDRDWPAIASQAPTNQDVLSAPEHAACVIYTSGSTGTPKGVVLEHRNLVNLVRSFIASYDPGVHDRILPLTAIASASFVGEVLPILCSGGAVVLPDKAEFLDFQKLIALIADQAVTILSTVPSFLAGINAIADQLPYLRLMLSGGEALFAGEVDRLLDSATIVNGYGLTETTVCSTYYRLQPADVRADGPIPIGGPLSNTQLYVLDARMQIVPIGAIGELYIGGAGIARGYLNDPAQTAARFVPNPFAVDHEQRTPETGRDPSTLDARRSSDRLYRTGDLARWLPSGVLEFHGRADQQVKIRGFRIELGEIETRIGQHRAVRETVVVARGADHALGAAHDTQLVAYVVPRTDDPAWKTDEQHTDDGTILHPAASFVADLRSFMREKLPDYMLPTTFVFVRALPLTTNGKVDTRALPHPDSVRPAISATYVAPQSEAERIISEVWQRVIGIDKVGVHDNFFELGGHSLLLVKAHTELRDAFDRPLSLVDLFKYPTVSSLAQYVSQAQETAPSLDRIQAVADKQRQARSRRQQIMRAATRRGESIDE